MKKRPPMSVVDLRDVKCFLCEQLVGSVSKIVIQHTKLGQMFGFVCSRTECAGRSLDYMRDMYVEQPIHSVWIPRQPT